MQLVVHIQVNVNDGLIAEDSFNNLRSVPEGHWITPVTFRRIFFSTLVVSVIGLQVVSIGSGFQQ